MANLIIPPRDLPSADSVFDTDALVVDNGSAVSKATPVQVVDAGRPWASIQEAQAGAVSTKSMSPFTTKSAIEALTADFLGAVPVSSYSQALAVAANPLISRISAIIEGYLIEWVRVEGGTCLGGGWRPANEITPVHWGAVANGISDETNAIQSSINEGQARKLPVTILGSYMVSGQINITSPVSVWFTESLNIAGTGYSVLNITSSDVFVSGAKMVHEDTVVSGSVSNTVVGINAVGAPGSKNIYISDVSFTRLGWHGIWVENYSNGLIKNVTADQCNLGPGDKSFGHPTLVNCDRIQVESVRSTNCGGKSVAFSFCTRCLASNITAVNGDVSFYTNGSTYCYATNVIGINMAGGGAKLSRNSRYCGISNSYLEGVTGGLYFDGSSLCVATNCELRGLDATGNGLRISTHGATSQDPASSANNNTVSNCVIRADTAAVVRVSSDVGDTDLISSFNTVSNSQFYPAAGQRLIELSICSRTDFNNCRGTSNADIGVNVSPNSNAATFSGCDFTASGIAITIAGTNTTVKNTSASSTGNYGVRIQSAAAGTKVMSSIISGTSSIRYERDNADVLSMGNALPNGESGSSTLIKKSGNLV